MKRQVRELLGKHTFCLFPLRRNSKRAPGQHQEQMVVLENTALQLWCGYWSWIDKGCFWKSYPPMHSP